MKDYLFVYGTLLPHRVPPGLREVMAQLRPVSAGFMPGQLYDMGEFPGAVFDVDAQGQVFGHVYELHDETQLQKLDEYEEYSPSHTESSLFVRQKQPITLTDGSKLLCWVYVYNRDPGEARPVPSGNYSEWIAGEQRTSSA
jgi:gamma-glutamylcyclotransferase (GGCT)/AIG2-like uncharacterized protein YtfP